MLRIKLRIKFSSNDTVIIGPMMPEINRISWDMSCAINGIVTRSNMKLETYKSSETYPMDLKQ